MRYLLLTCLWLAFPAILWGQIVLENNVLRVEVSKRGNVDFTEKAANRIWRHDT